MVFSQEYERQQVSSSLYDPLLLLLLLLLLICEKRDKYSDLARELKLLNMTVTVISVVIGAVGTIPKDSLRELEKLGIEDEQIPWKL